MSILKETKLEAFLLRLCLFTTPLYLLGLGFPAVISPIYLFFPIAFFFGILALIKRPVISDLTIIFGLYQFVVLALLLIQSAVLDLNKGIINELVRIAFPPTLFITYYSILRDREIEELKRLIVFFIKSSTIVMFFELIGRLALFVLNARSGFYKVKDASPFYPDSNFAGFLLLIIFGLILLLKDKYRLRAYPGSILVTSVLILLTLSRAAIIAGFIILGFLFFKRLNILLKIAVVLFGCFVAVFVIDYVVSDGSFQTKLNIFSIFGEWLDYPMHSLLLGIGSGNMKAQFGEESHNIFGLTVELGFIWVVVFLFQFGIMLKKIGASANWILFPILLAGTISLYPITYLGILYVAFAFLSVISLSENRNKFISWSS